MLCPLRRRKKKANFIIPPTYYRNSGYSIIESQKSKVESINVERVHAEKIVPKIEIEVDKPETHPTSNAQLITPNQPKVSALSLASIKAKKEMAETQKSITKEIKYLPNEAFTETQLLEQWVKYAQKLEDKGQKIMSSLLTLNDPKLDATVVTHELPNESSKIDFERELPHLLGYLRGKLHNHDLEIKVVINESIEIKKAFTAQDKYNRFVELNPNIELLRKFFDLDI